MNKEELNSKLEAIQKECDLAKKRIRLEYAKANNPHQLGDVIQDHLGKIEIDDIKYLVSGGYHAIPCCVYQGRVINKNGKYAANNKRRSVYQGNIEEKYNDNNS